MDTLIAPAINLLILICALIYFLRTPLKNFVSQRHVVLRDELARVRELLASAQRQHEEFSAKLKAFDAEATTLRAQMATDAEQAKSRLIQEAQRLSAQIITDARSSADAMVSGLRAGLQGELATQVLARAEKIMREKLTGDDRTRLREEFSKQVETVQ
jgi:F0F1-type ATP synthase membrane subunit b/b'